MPVSCYIPNVVLYSLTEWPVISLYDEDPELCNRFRINFFCATKNAIFLVLPVEEVSLPPELSSPPRFRTKGGYPERDKGVGVVAGQDFPFLI